MTMRRACVFLTREGDLLPDPTPVRIDRATEVNLTLPFSSAENGVVCGPLHPISRFEADLVQRVVSRRYRFGFHRA